MRRRPTTPSGSSTAAPSSCSCPRTRRRPSPSATTCKTFYDLTGIEVEILTDDLPVVQQKVGIDLRGGKADFQLNYVQDKPIGAPFADFYAEPAGIHWRRHAAAGSGRLSARRSGSRTSSIACGDVLRREPAGRLPLRLRGRLHLLPAGPVRAAHARTSRRNTATGWSSPRTPPGSRSTTSPPSSRSCARAGTDVPYGYAQHQGSFAWTTQLDIQRMLFAHGRWIDFDIDDKLGSKTPGPTKWGDEQSILMMQKFKELADVCHPDNLANGTLRAEHRLSGRPDRDAGAVSRVRRLDRGREDLGARPAARPPTRPARRARRSGSRTAARRSTAAIAASAASASTATPRRT